MALDLVNEHDSMLSKCGSFWYGTVNRRDKSIAHMLEGMACHTDAVSRLANGSSYVLSGGYFHGFNRVLRFSDSDISYNGTDKALQALYNGHTSDDGSIVVKDVTALACDGTAPAPMKGAPEADENRFPVIFPYKDGVDSDMLLPASYRAVFGLKVPDDILVTSIEDDDGTVLVEGIDFVAEFGRLWMQHNPAALFPGMKFMARSFTRRCKNLYCYPLRLDSIYGPVDRVMHYYRVSQSPSAFKYAAAQACGMAVTRRAVRIAEVEPLLGGASYISCSGYRLDAPYPHVRLERGTVLPAGYIVGGGYMFDMVLPGESGVGVESIDTASALPVRLAVDSGTICSKCIVDGVEYDRPVDCSPGQAPENGNSRFNAYWKWLASEDGGPESWETGMEAAGPVDGIEWTRERACGGIAIVVRVNEGVMPYDMQVKLHNFILREAPIGCLLTYSPIAGTILER